MRVFECLASAAGRLPRSEARLLLAAAIGRPKEFLIAHPDAELSDEESLRVESFFRRAQAGEPIPYIVGFQEFWGRPFHVTPATLIPRPDTETLVEEALAFLRGKTGARVLDLGTGSGCIAVTLALECPRASVFACDKSEAALEAAKENARSLDAAVTFSASDWFGAYAGHTFDLIVSNPPYIEENDEHLKALTFEPVTALTAGADGLDDIRTLASEALNHLKPGGCMLVEHGYNQGEPVRALFEKAGFSDVRTIFDLGGRARVCRAVR